MKELERKESSSKLFFQARESTTLVGFSIFPNQVQEGDASKGPLGPHQSSRTPWLLILKEGRGVGLALSEGGAKGQVCLLPHRPKNWDPQDPSQPSSPPLHSLGSRERQGHPSMGGQDGLLILRNLDR